eukprot:1161232-Pelagomonas_calceolata.AAC.10
MQHRHRHQRSRTIHSQAPSAPVASVDPQTIGRGTAAKQRAGDVVVGCQMTSEAALRAPVCEGWCGCLHTVPAFSQTCCCKRSKFSSSQGRAGYADLTLGLPMIDANIKNDVFVSALPCRERTLVLGLRQGSLKRRCSLPACSYCYGEHECNRFAAHRTSFSGTCPFIHQALLKEIFCSAESDASLSSCLSTWTSAKASDILPLHVVRTLPISKEKESYARGVSPQVLIKGRGYQGRKHWEPPPPPPHTHTHTPQGLDPGFTSVSGYAQGGTVCYNMQDPLLLGFPETSGQDMNQRKGGTLTQRAVSLSHKRVRGLVVWVWWVSGSTQPQGTKIIMSVIVFNGTSGCGLCTI